MVDTTQPTQKYTQEEIQAKIRDYRKSCLSSFLRFTKAMYKLRTGREFEISHPDGRESHFITIAKELSDVVRGNNQNLIINVPPRYGKCTHELTRVLTTSGLKYIKDISIGDMLYSYDEGRLSIQRCLAIEKTNKEAIKIKMRSGREIICSKDHRLLTTHGYKEAASLKIKERIKALNTIIDGKNRIDQNELTFITMMIFDGCCRSTMRFSKLEPATIKIFYNACEALGITVKQYASNNICDHNVLNNDCIARNLLIKYGINNKLCYDKRLPLDWFSMPLDQKYLFLDLMFATDGYINGKRSGTCGIALANKGLIEDIQYLLSTIGIISIISYKANNKRGAWVLTITRECTQKLFTQITFLHKRFKAKICFNKSSASTINNYPNSILKGLNSYAARKNGVRIDNKKDVNKDRFERLCILYPELEKYRNFDFYLDEIVNIEDIGIQPLVHLQVEKTENFIANGLVSHNSELAIHFVAWTMAMYPDSNFLYVSYSHELAAKQTATIRSIITMRDYRNVFGVQLKEESQAKHNFETTREGSVYAAGAGGTITGRGAGIRGVFERFSGAIIIDDIHKPDEATSDTIREGVIEWYHNTMISRRNNAKTPIIFIGQRVHESDLAAHLIKEEEFKLISIPAIDGAGNVLHPGLHTKQMLIEMESRTPYIYAAQYQQNPQPAGGGIFKPEWFYTMDEEPEILATFITADTAETDKTYNDATVFSFWGVYRIKNERAQTDEFALHWLDCRELHVEPKDLEAEFMDFYTLCCRHYITPMVAAIEKKSTGVTLSSILKNLRGLRILEIERTRASGSKIERFLRIQPYIASRLVSMNRSANHKDMVIEHMRKITANMTHAKDDICDSAVDAITLALIDKVIVSRIINPYDYSNQAKSLMSTYSKINELRKSAYKS